MKLVVKDTLGKPQGELEIGFPLAEGQRGTHAVHEVVVAHLANRRRGTACTKTMGEVAGTGKKPWRQKGTGRARAGSFQSPLWRGGGVVFGPKPRDFSLKVNAQTKRLALRKALTERLKAGDVIVVDDLSLPNHKTRTFLNVLQALEAKGTVLVVASPPDRNLLLASRNVPYVEVTTGENLHAYDVLRPDTLVFTRAAFQVVENRLREE